MSDTYIRFSFNTHSPVLHNVGQNKDKIPSHVHGSVKGVQEIKGLPQSLELGTKIEIQLFISHQNDSGVSGDIFLNHTTVVCVCVCVYRVMDDGV